ncbi:putative glycerol-3-phosphate dehydrogenase [Trichinella spiralis]|uniref:Glycerol-3-phosphate dehydrogenase [NAD(+)] n=1 Tax=Trichinella spiralis TaxID=6334 RepID=A0ABR3KXU0_TRISP
MRSRLSTLKVVVDIFRWNHSVTMRKVKNPPNLAMVHKVAIVGGGSWGSALSVIVGESVERKKHLFDTSVKLWLLREEVNGEDLADLINRQHENLIIRFSFFFLLRIASSDIALCVGDADILIMAVPQQFLAKTCENIVGKIKPTAIAVTTIKGIEVDEKGKMCVSSVIIQKILNIPVAALNGANIAPEVAEKHFCEATIGVQREQDGQLLKQVFNIPTFHVNVVRDLQTVEYCGALKNVVACAAGLVDGLKFGTNTKSAVIRIGFLEMINL